MNREAAEVAYDEASLVARVACSGQVLTGGREDGRLFGLHLTTSRVVQMRAPTGVAVTALAISPDGKRLAFGDEDGSAGVSDLPPLA
jgi:WD40 repeat protein